MLKSDISRAFISKKTHENQHLFSFFDKVIIVVKAFIRSQYHVEGTRSFT